MAQTTLRPAIAYLDAAPSLPLLASAAVKVAVTVAKWSERRQSRLALADVDPNLLDDIGVSPDQARRESARPFWQG